MKNKGVVWASDRNERRLDTLKRRAARAKLFNYRTDFWDGGREACPPRPSSTAS
jgi:16S rRNA (cytosine967-C5)-methyltransferase